jgi:hypothetical protein
MTITQALDYTGPENRGKCGFCGKEEGGYAKKDANGEWQAACWPCVKPKNATAVQSKRNLVGTAFTDTSDDKPAARKSPGMAPSAHRPRTN